MPTDAGAEPSKEGNAFFEQKIRPILVEHCYACHSQQAEKLKSNLYLDSKEGWERGGDYGEPAIVPGDPARSLLLRSIR
ncbi:MAG: c-type cytochrome domain-containing protein, partial [Pirellulaceae bacterium]